MPDVAGERARDRPDEIEVRVNGAPFFGWEAVQVTRRLDAAAGAFRLEVAQRQPWPVLPGDAVEILVEGSPVLTGFVDQLDGRVTDSGSSFTVAGRDVTGDLVDCSADVDGGEFFGLHPGQIAVALAKPFPDVLVRYTIRPVEPFDIFKVEQGETVWSAIERAARMRGLLAYTEGDGALVVVEPSKTRAEVDLIQGGAGNVLEATLRWSHEDRFQTYIVRGQAPGDDDTFGELVAQVEATASDGEVRRARPLVIVGETSLTPDLARDRAQWEATVRASRAAVVTVKVQGWRQKPTSDLWRVNQRVDVAIPRLQVESPLLVNAVKLERGPGGTLTTLELVRPDSYTLQPAIPEGDDSAIDKLLRGETVTPQAEAPE